MDGEHVAGKISGQRCGRGWICGNRTSEIVCAKWLRSLRHGGKRLGMGERLGSPRLLSNIARKGGRGAKPPGPRFTIRPCRAERKETGASRRLVLVQRSILFALHRW